MNKNSSDKITDNSFTEMSFVHAKDLSEVRDHRSNIRCNVTVCDNNIVCIRLCKGTKHSAATNHTQQYIELIIMVTIVFE